MDSGYAPGFWILHRSQLTTLPRASITTEYFFCFPWKIAITQYFRIYFISSLLFVPSGLVDTIPVCSTIPKNTFTGTVMFSFGPRVETYNAVAVA